MEAQFKRVPALDKCFDILEFLARCERPVGVSELSKATSQKLQGFAKNFHRFGG